MAVACMIALLIVERSSSHHMCGHEKVAYIQCSLQPVLMSAWHRSSYTSIYGNGVGSR